MAKAKITGVWMDNGIYTVKYATGTEKIYPANKLPKTVLSWIDSNSNQKPEQATEPEQQEEANTMATHETESISKPESVKASDKAEQKEIRMEVQEMRNAEITTATASARSPKASETVMFWLCAGLCIGLQIFLYSVQIAFIGMRSFVLYVWEHREEIKARFHTVSNRAWTAATTAAEIIKAESVKAFEIFTTATTTAYNYVIASLPKLETVKDAAIIHGYESIRAAIITVSIIAFTARITAR